MVLVILMVGALFPSVGDSIGRLDVPKGVAELLGRRGLRKLAGWMRSEIGAVYGPLVIGAVAIVGRRRVHRRRGGRGHPRADARAPDPALAR